MVLPINQVLPSISFITPAVQPQSRTFAGEVFPPRVHPRIDIHELVSGEETFFVGPIVEDVLEQECGG